jgi:hypothetical protein
MRRFIDVLYIISHVDTRSIPHYDGFLMVMRQYREGKPMFDSGRTQNVKIPCGLAAGFFILT